MAEPSKRSLQLIQPAQHFYEHAIRFEELFTRLVLPLRDARSIRHETMHGYRTIYFPAQQLHFRRDNPKSTATLIVGNDPRLLTRARMSRKRPKTA